MCFCKSRIRLPGSSDRRAEKQLWKQQQITLFASLLLKRIVWSTLFAFLCSSPLLSSSITIMLPLRLKLKDQESRLISFSSIATFFSSAKLHSVQGHPSSFPKKSYPTKPCLSSFLNAFSLVSESFKPMGDRHTFMLAENTLTYFDQYS